METKMDQDEAGLADLVATDVGATPAETPEQTQTEAPAQAEETKTVEAPQAQTTEQQTTEGVTAEEAPTEPLQEQKQTDPAIDWTQFIPSPSAVEEPQPDENGQIDGQAYARYVIDQAKNELRQESEIRANVVKGVEQAEAVLPAMKTNPKIAALVQSQAIADTVKGGKPNFVSAAQTIKELLGEERAAATNNAQVSITTQKAAAVENGSSTRVSEPNRGRELADRINSNDQDAFVELIDEWTKQGVI